MERNVYTFIAGKNINLSGKQCENHTAKVFEVVPVWIYSKEIIRCNSVIYVQEFFIAALSISEKVETH